MIPNKELFKFLSRKYKIEGTTIDWSIPKAIKWLRLLTGITEYKSRKTIHDWIHNQIGKDTAVCEKLPPSEHEYLSNIIIRYTKNGKLHRDDGPAITRSNGTKAWYQNGDLHRDDGPAIIWKNGSEEWYQNGKLHREDGPAGIYPNGVEEWYQNGKLHRDDGPAYIDSNGYKMWYRYGKWIK